MLTDIKFSVTVCSYLVYSSASKKEKKFFLFFTLTPSHMWLKRPVYRGFRGGCVKTPKNSQSPDFPKPGLCYVQKFLYL